jgi:hypothetical protein
MIIDTEDNIISTEDNTDTEDNHDQGLDQGLLS